MIRFTQTDKWKDTWFRRLKPAEKLLFLYLVDNCDNAGFIEFDPEFVAFVTGMQIEQIEGAIQGLNRGLIGADKGEVYFIKNFLHHQKNLPLNPENNAHKQIIFILNEKEHLFKKSGAIKGLISPIGKGKVKVKVNVEYTEEFEKFWEAYPNKKSKPSAYKSFTRVSENVDVLIAAVKENKKSHDWKKENGRYIPMPATWLNNDMWNDEVDTTTPAKKLSPDAQAALDDWNKLA